jgi:hypothetical protein
MTAVDEEYIIWNLLDKQWIDANTPPQKPPVYYKDDMRTADRHRGVKVYYVDGTCEPRSLGFAGEKIVVRMCVDFWSANRDDFVNLRAEIDRILKANRISPGGDFDWMEPGEGRKLASYGLFYRMVIDIQMHVTNRPIP